MIYFLHEMYLNIIKVLSSGHFKIFYLGYFQTSHAIIFFSFLSFLNFRFQSCVNSSQISVKLSTLNHGRAQWHSLRPRRASANHGKQFDWLYIPLRVAAQHHDWFQGMFFLMTTTTTMTNVVESQLVRWSNYKDDMSSFPVLNNP